LGFVIGVKKDGVLRAIHLQIKRGYKMTEEIGKLIAMCLMFLGVYLLFTVNR